MRRLSFWVIRGRFILPYGIWIIQYVNDWGSIFCHISISYLAPWTSVLLLAGFLFNYLFSLSCDGLPYPLQNLVMVCLIWNFLATLQLILTSMIPWKLAEEENTLWRFCFLLLEFRPNFAYILLIMGFLLRRITVAFLWLRYVLFASFCFLQPLFKEFMLVKIDCRGPKNSK